MDIVTGFRNTAHITSNDMQAFNRGVFSNKRTDGATCLLKGGNNLAASILSNTSVQLSDGDAVAQGVHFRIRPGGTETVTLSPGTSGYKRWDAICAHYERNVSTGIESVTLEVVEGAPSTGTPTKPTLAWADVVAGSTSAYFRLYDAYFSGTTLQSVTSAMLEPQNLNALTDTAAAQQAAIDDINDRLVDDTEVSYVSGSGVLSAFGQGIDLLKTDYHQSGQFYGQHFYYDSAGGIADIPSLLSDHTEQIADINTRIGPLEVIYHYFGTSTSPYVFSIGSNAMFLFVLGRVNASSAYNYMALSSYGAGSYNWSPILQGEYPPTFSWDYTNKTLTVTPRATYCKATIIKLGG